MPLDLLIYPSTMQTHRLVLIRHAKAESFASADVERVLSPGGRDDARALGAWLSGQDVAPDHALVSFAARTRETWAQVAHGAGWELEPSYDGTLYGTDEIGLLDLLREVPADAATVVVIGHNPTMEIAAQLLDDGEGTATGSVSLGSFPTATAAVFTLVEPWSEISEMAGRLDAFHVARAEH